MNRVEKELIADNLRAFEHNFGKVRIVKENYGRGFYVFSPADSENYVQYCYNADYLNGWLYGCVQAANKMVRPVEREREKMKLELEFFSALCATSKFQINGINAVDDDFGSSEDVDPQNAPDYGCGNRKFITYEPREEILSKYSITTDEYYEVCDRLEEGLSFGRCAWCS